jgi:hypothetical protein
MGYLFASNGGTNLYRSIDHGTSWQPIATGLEGRRAQALIAVGSVLYAGTDRGIFHSLDSGMHWIKDAPSDIENFSVASLLLSDGTLYAGTGGGGVWELPLFNAKVESFHTAGTSIHVWPNPAHGSSTISYSLKTDCNPHFQIVDESGCVIQQWDGGYEVSGEHSFSVDCHSLAKGNYFVELCFGDDRSCATLCVK